MYEAEIWSPARGYEGFYSISNFGRVRSEARVVYGDRGKKQSMQERILSPARKKSGHLSVQLHRNGVKRIHVHRLVAFAFIGDSPTDLHEVAHNDGNPSNNIVSNLRWATRSENLQDKVAHGTHNRGQAHPLAKLSESDVRAIRAPGANAYELAKLFGVSVKHVWSIMAGKSRRYDK